MWRDVALAFSLANLCLMRVWGRVVFFGSADVFHMKRFPGAASILAAGINLLLLGTLIWLALRASRMQRRVFGWPGRLTLLAAALVGINSVRAVVFGQFPALRGAVVSALESHLPATLAATVLVAALALFAAGGRLRRAGGAVLMILAPLAPISMMGAASRLLRSSRYTLSDPKLAPRTPRLEFQYRVVWVIFDEWDFRSTFEARPGTLKTPNLDRFAKEALFATEAYPPAINTLESIPALLAGERFQAVSRLGPSELLVLRTGSTSPVPWPADSSVIARARASGANTAIAGWYLPYCRILAPVLNACHWCELTPTDPASEGLQAGIAPAVTGQIRSLFETAQYSFLGRSQGFEGHVRSYRELLARGLRFAADPGLEFVFLHFPIPHAPYLRENPDGTLQPGAYADSLALLDHTLGRLFEAMDSTGVRQSTHLLLSADHSLRAVNEPARRIPFLLKLAGDRRARIHSRRFGAEASGELLLRAMRGEIETHEAAADWLSSVN